MSRLHREIIGGGRMMERLTDKVRNYDGTATSKQSLVVEEGLRAGSPSDYCSKIVTKLADYEDLEEQGLLLKLPCKVGTEVYEIEQQFWIDRKGCKDCVYFGNDGLGDYCDYCEDEPAACTKIVPREFTMRMLEDFGKTVFLTREEAEQALEKMKGE